MSFITSRADHNVDLTIRACLSRKPVARSVAWPQIDNLKALIKSKGELYFQMLVLPSNYYRSKLNDVEATLPELYEVKK